VTPPEARRTGPRGAVGYALKVFTCDMRAFTIRYVLEAG
jgi:hypothetical protein